MTSVERTGWRDEEISRRHRDWGFNCPAVDLDFLMVEYNIGKPVGLIEYKHYYARLPDLRHPTYRALTDLADTAALPFLLAFYWPGIWAFKITPVNNEAKEHFRQNETLCERDFVRKLYRIRRLCLTKEIDGILKTDMPPEVRDAIG